MTTGEVIQFLCMLIIVFLQIYEWRIIGLTISEKYKSFVIISLAIVVISKIIGG